MNFIKSFCIQNWLKLSTLIIFLILSSTIIQQKKWEDQYAVISSEVSSHYSYLPALFVYNDLSLSFIKSLPDEWSNNVWVAESPKGGKTLKMTSGVAILMLPFFLLAHLLALIGGTPNGYSDPYAISILFSSAFYTALALFFLAKVLIKYSSKIAVILTLFLLLLGTNLFAYSTFLGGHSHAYSFFLFSLFIYLVIQFYSKKQKKHALLLGLCLGLISLIRPTNGLIGLLFLLYNVSSYQSLKSRITLFKNEYRCILIIIVGLVICWIPQLIIWKINTGQFFYYAYGNEGFFFSDPEIIKGLFGYRSGWFLYTPLMLVASLSIIIMAFNQKLRRLYLSSFVFFLPLNVYFILSWWCWWYGEGFGHRAFIESYALLAIPLVVVIDKSLVLKNWVSKFWLIVLAVLFVYLNIFQTSQFKNGILHPEAMSEKAYWTIFGEPDVPSLLPCFLEYPNYDFAKDKGQDLSENNNCDHIVFRSLSELKKFKKNGTTNYAKNGVFKIENGKELWVYCGYRSNAKGISISLDENDIYKISLFKNDASIYSETLVNKHKLKGLKHYRFNFPEVIQEKGFDWIRIIPKAGDNEYYIGHLILFRK